MCNPIREFKSRPPHFPFRAMRSPEKTEKIVQLRGFETETSVNLKMNPKPKPISPDIYNWETRYNSTLDRLKNDSRISERNRVRLKGFLESRVPTPFFVVPSFTGLLDSLGFSTYRINR